MEFSSIVMVAEHCRGVLAERGLNGIYNKRLDFEIAEITKQGADTYWLGLIGDDCKFDKNPNNLVLPWLLGMIDTDPIAGRTDPIITTTAYAKVLKFINEHGKLPPEITRDSDNPDIDVDCLPEARDPIKDYATKKYSVGIDDGYGAVCSVGTWMTYLLRSAIKDVAKAKAACDVRQVDIMTKELPDEVDDLKDNGESACKGCNKVHREAKCPACGSPDTEYPTIGRLLEDHQLLRQFNEAYPDVINLAVRLVGRIRAMGKHAGALIIADRPLFGNIPMSLDANTKQWKSLWTEGRNTQLSKFGYTKWDWLGLKNLRYIYEASRMIEENHGISFGERTVKGFMFTPGHKVHIPSMSGWDYSDPEKRHGGYYYDRNNRMIYMDLDDPKIMEMASEGKTDAVFQFDTDLAKRILSNGVYNFNDLLIFNAMGHPGPMAMIPDYVERRNDPQGEWRNSIPEAILRVLEETHGTIVFQEQLQTLWQRVAGFTAPEAQEARKAVAKKWRDKLKPIGEKWLRGAGPTIGEAQAAAWWEKQVSFGRYAFNKSHAVSYCLVAYHCLWLKTYFPHEWWAAVKSYCNADKLVRYMNVARGDGVRYAPMDINNLTFNFTVVPDESRLDHTVPPNGHIMPGLVCLKGIGEKVASAFTGQKPPMIQEADTEEADAEGGAYSQIESDVQEPVVETDTIEDVVVQKTGPIESVDDIVERKGKNKLLMERLIKLGSFSSLSGHSCAKAVWTYYLAKYCTGPDVTQLKAELRAEILTAAGWNDQTIAAEQKRQEGEFRSLFPKRKVPKKITAWQPKPNITLEEVMKIRPGDFTLSEILGFEEQYLGYHLHSPLDLFVTHGGRTIRSAKENGILEAVITDVYHTKTRTNMPMCRLTVSDGILSASLIIWSDELMKIDKTTLRINRGISVAVDWDPNRRNFTLCSGTRITRLKVKDENET